MGGLRGGGPLGHDVRAPRAVRAQRANLPRRHRPDLARDGEQDHLLQLAQDEDLDRGRRAADVAWHLPLAAQPPRVQGRQEGPLPVHPRGDLLRRHLRLPRPHHLHEVVHGLVLPPRPRRRGGRPARRRRGHLPAGAVAPHAPHQHVHVAHRRHHRPALRHRVLRRGRQPRLRRRGGGGVLRLPRPRRRLPGVVRRARRGG
mmetsp:Transcript_11253/g.35952  ORF Transcript_11253/g.35952 Transcript_11253/m.35952 type:complete len:201 (+) Transcript_11253:1507-2109(+)